MNLECLHECLLRMREICERTSFSATGNRGKYYGYGSHSIFILPFFSKIKFLSIREKGVMNKNSDSMKFCCAASLDKSMYHTNSPDLPAVQSAAPNGTSPTSR